MAFLKFSVIFCSFLILQAQALPQDQVSQHQVANVSNIIDIIEFIVKMAENMIDGILNTISKTLDKLIMEPDTLQTKIVSIFEKVLDVIAVTADKQINVIKEKGNANTKVILGCIQGEEEKIRNMALASFNNHSKCLAKEFVILQKAVKSIVGDLQEVQGDFKKALTKLDTCHGNDQEAITCALGVAAETMKVVKEIPDITSEDINNLAELVVTFPNSVLSCVKPNANTFGTTVMEIFDDISTCSRQQ